MDITVNLNKCYYGNNRAPSSSNMKRQSVLHFKNDGIAYLFSQNWIPVLIPSFSNY